jgi:uncharacterized protein YbaR (Trm112 family)
MVDPELVQLLCCPETHQELRLLDPTLLQELNAQIASGSLKTRSGQPVRAALDGGLIRTDGKFVYPIRHDIPIMLVDEAIPLDGPRATRC